MQKLTFRYFDLEEIPDAVKLLKEQQIQSEFVVVSKRPDGIKISGNGVKQFKIKFKESEEKEND